ncbi:MAG TPA: vWA domain-containing protein, partial [Pirellulales bacterium]
MGRVMLKTMVDRAALFLIAAVAFGLAFANVAQAAPGADGISPPLIATAGTPGSAATGASTGGDSAATSGNSQTESATDPNAPSRTRYELSRIQSFSEWWQTPLLVLVCLLVLVFVGLMYRKDSVELKPGVGVLLTLLRLAAFAGVLLMYLDVERRSETKVVHNSRVVLLVDTSLSMSRTDADDVPPGTPATQRRIDPVAEAIQQSPFITDLRHTHDVEVVKFDADVRRLTTLQKIATGPNGEPITAESTDGQQPQTNGEGGNSTASSGNSGAAPAKLDWKKELEPQGAETRIGQAVRQIINDERGVPLSGIVVFTDGGQNAGVDVQAAIKAAQEAKVPIHVVGLGSDKRPTNVRISDLVAPARAYPGDSFHVTGYVQAQSLAGRTATVELAVLPLGEGKDSKAVPAFEKTERVQLAGDAESVPVRFDVPAFDTAGHRVVRIRVMPMAEDKDPSDNQQEVDVDVVDRKSKVLLFAGGPTREYQFLRNMLRRSELAKANGDMVVDVLLQSAAEGVSQDANQILNEFPRTMTELSQYDTIVAFDPDWRELDPGQVDLVEKWVGEEAGGLIGIAGPVYTDAWVQTPSLATIRKLYPVEFNRRLAVLEDARYGSQQPWPLDFTREGMEAEFMRLDETAESSREIWDAFKGVFGYYRVRGPKLGATTYALFSDPEAAIGDQKPVYFAGQFYGSGRVFYMGSGEMWRLRVLGEKYFDTFYTKLIRHVSQGRLLRGSKLGNLLVERDRFVVGNTIVVRAQLLNQQHQPLEAPKVNVQVTQRDGVPMSIALTADPARKGMYSGQFTATQEGEVRLELIHPDAPDEPLTRRLQVFMPKLEQEKPERNDKLLKELADGTGGQMYIGVPAALGPNSAKPLVAQLADKTQETYVSGKKDRVWEEHWMHAILALIAGCLSLEWLIRRLCR